MLSDRHVKIVATIGPAIDTPEGLKKAVESGMNVARLNFSHGTQENHLRVIQALRQISKDLQAPLTVLQDLQGPKVRVGMFKAGSIPLKAGEIVEISPEFSEGDVGKIPSDFKELPQSVHKDSRILLDDGLLELKVVEVRGSIVRAEVISGGTLKNRKGMNLPGARLPVDCMTPKDLNDLEFGIKHGVDYIALSFVRHAEDIRQLKEIIRARGSQARVIAKIEMTEAVENLEEIIRVSDAVMVARGDLAVEIGQSHLPAVQKRIIKLCNQIGRPVITATQMLESMIENPRPTRAEITDVANAVLDGTDAVMLSAESASGKYPFQSIQTMHEIITEVEKTNVAYYNMTMDDEFLSVAEAIGASSCLSALKLNAAAIVCLTTTGKTATLISSFRPKARIIAVTHMLPTLNRLELVWGLRTIQINPYQTVDQALEQIEKLLLEYGLIKTGDRVVLTLGTPLMEGGTTNTLRVFTVGSTSLTVKSADQLPLRFRPKI